MLFSEPKIPQSADRELLRLRNRPFSALQRAENSSIQEPAFDVKRFPDLSVLFSEPKIPQSKSRPRNYRRTALSVLFSEPKIPQLRLRNRLAIAREAFSALQRAENSSIRVSDGRDGARVQTFSALQRAENSSIVHARIKPDQPQPFQCSSASRKFLNAVPRPRGGVSEVFQCSSASRKFLNDPHTEQPHRLPLAFSALQRAENSSITDTPYNAARVL